MKIDPKTNAKRTSRRVWRTRWKRIVSTLAAITVFCTTYALILPAITVNSETYCGMEEHEHTEECYTLELICGFEEGDVDVQEGVQGETSVEPEAAPEAATEPEAVESESKENKTETRIETITTTELQQVLVDEGHVHSDDCYEDVSSLICGQEEVEAKEAVIDEETGEVVEEAVEGHTHTEACYEVERVLTCGQEEREPVYEEQEVDVEREVEVEVPVEAEDAAEEPAEETAPAVEPATVEPAPATEKHVHTEECYRKVLTCEKQEHKHTDECFANLNVDLETAATWEKTLPKDSELTGVWAEDVLTIAKSQLGYKESSRNFKVVDGERKGYTRYGAMFGVPYGDWCAMFIQFSMHYAGVDSRLMPASAGVPTWIENMEKIDNFFPVEEYTPEVGNIVFFDWDSKPGDESDVRDGDHVGIVAEVKTKEETNIDGEKVEVATAIVAIEGNSANEVRYNTYRIDDETIMGYSVMPEKPETEEELEARLAEIEEIEIEKEKEEPSEEVSEAAEETKEETDPETIIELVSYTESGVQVNFSAPWKVFPEGTKDPALNVVEIEEGTPEYDAYKAQAESQLAGDESKVTSARFFDITVVDINGKEIKLNDESVARVNIVFPENEAIESKDDVNVLHFAEEGPEVLGSETQGISGVGGVAFDTPGFSVFGVVSTTAVTTRYISDSGVIYEVTVTYGPEAELPDDAALSVTEYAEDSDEYKTVTALIEQEEEVHNDVIDISIVDSEGNKLEPAAPVDVDLVVIRPEDNVEVFAGDLTITHIKETDGELVPEAVEIKETETKELDKDLEITKAVSFTIDGFSAFNVAWGTANNHVDFTVFYGYSGTNGVFREISSEKANANTFKNIGQSPSNGTNIDLGSVYPANTQIFGKAIGTPVGYYYLNPRRRLMVDTNNPPDQVGISIGKDIRVNNGRWQYYANGAWADIEDGSEIYVKYGYQPEFNVAQEDPTKHGGDDYVPLSNIQDDSDLGVPAHEKTKTSNGDGTYTLALNVTGKQEEAKAGTKADVTIIYDTSGSMGNFSQYYLTDSDGQTKARWKIVRPAVAKLVNDLMAVNEAIPDAVHMSLIRFSNTGGIHVTHSNSAETVINEIPQFGSGRTNWEDGILAYSGIKNRADAKQYLIFVTDGDPTLRNTAGPWSYREVVLRAEDGTEIELTEYQIYAYGIQKVYNSYPNDYYYVDVNNRLGKGRNAKFNHPRSWDGNGDIVGDTGEWRYGYSVESGSVQMSNNMMAARLYMSEILRAGQSQYQVKVIGIGAFLNSESQSRLQTMVGAAGGIAYHANNYNDFVSIFDPLVEEIATELHYENVKITDGITKHAAHVLKNGSSDNFQYYRYGGQYGDPWSKVGAAYKNKPFQELPANVKAQFAWTDAPAAVYRATNSAEESGKVEWDLSSINVEAGVTYEVAFQVWPDQYSYDTASDIKNELKTYNSLSAADKGQILQNGDNLEVKTNTGAEVEYTEVKSKNGTVISRKDNSDTYNDVDPMPLNLMKIRIKKDWFNDEATLAIKQEFENNNKQLQFRFTEDSEFQKNVNLKGTSWSEEVYVAVGLLVSNPYRIANGNTVVYNVDYDNNKINIRNTGATYGSPYYDLNDGHTYGFEENLSAADKARFTYTPTYYHPYLINGVPRMVKVTPGMAWEIVPEANEYVIGTNRANADVNGELAINKKVLDASGNTVTSDDTEFNVRVQLTKNGTGFNGMTYVIMNGNTVVKSAVSGHPDVIDQTTGERPISSNTADGHTFKIKQGQTIVIKDVPSGSSYVVSEVDEAGYVLNGFNNNGTVITTSVSNGNLVNATATGTVGGAQASVEVRNEKRASLSVTKNTKNLAGANISSDQQFYVKLKITKPSGGGYSYNADRVSYNILDANGEVITTHVDGHPDMLSGEEFRRPGAISSTGFTDALRFPITVGQTIVFNGLPTDAQWEIEEETTGLASSGYELEGYSINGVLHRSSKLSGELSDGDTEAFFNGPHKVFNTSGIYLLYSTDRQAYVGVDASGNLTLIPERSGTPYYEEVFDIVNNLAQVPNNADIRKVLWRASDYKYNGSVVGTVLQSLYFTNDARYIQYSSSGQRLVVAGNSNSYMPVYWNMSNNGTLSGTIGSNSHWQSYSWDFFASGTPTISSCSATGFNFYTLDERPVSENNSIAIVVENKQIPSEFEISKELETYSNTGNPFRPDQLFWFEVSITDAAGNGYNTATDGVTYSILQKDENGVYQPFTGDMANHSPYTLETVSPSNTVVGIDGLRKTSVLCSNAGHYKTDLMRFPLKANQKIVFHNLPIGSSWTVKEINLPTTHNLEGYKVNGTDATPASDGTVSGSTGTTIQSVEVTNSEVGGNVEVYKQLTGLKPNGDTVYGDDTLFWFLGSLTGPGENETQGGYNYAEHAITYILYEQDENGVYQKVLGNDTTAHPELAHHGAIINEGNVSAEDGWRRTNTLTNATTVNGVKLTDRKDYTSNLLFPLKANQMVKFINIPIGATLKLQEVALGDNYDFVNYIVGSQVITKAENSSAIPEAEVTISNDQTIIFTTNNEEKSTTLDISKQIVDDLGAVVTDDDDTFFWVEGSITGPGGDANNENGYQYAKHGVKYVIKDENGEIIEDDVIMDAEGNVRAQDSSLNLEDGEDHCHTPADPDGTRKTWGITPQGGHTNYVKFPIKSGWTVEFINLPIGATWKFKEVDVPNAYEVAGYSVKVGNTTNNNPSLNDSGFTGYVHGILPEENTSVTVKNRVDVGELVIGKLVVDYKHDLVSGDNNWFKIYVKIVDKNGNGLTAYNYGNTKLTYTIYKDGVPQSGTIASSGSGFTHPAVITGKESTAERPINTAGNNTTSSANSGKGIGMEIQSGMSIVIHNLPKGATWTIVEDSKDGYTLEGFTKPDTTLDVDNKNHLTTSAGGIATSATGTIAAGENIIDVHNKKNLPEVILEKVDNSDSSIKLPGAEFKLMSSRLSDDSVLHINIFEPDDNLSDWDGENAVGGIVNTGLGGWYGYGPTKLSATGYDNIISGNIYTVNNGADLFIRPDGYLVRNSNRNELLTNKNGNLVRYLPVTVETAGTNARVSLGELAPGTYYLKETKAPDGYQLPTTKIKIVVSDNYSVTAFEVASDGSNVKALTVKTDGGKPVVVAENRAGQELPDTGGIGTVIYTTAGILLMLVAAALLMYRLKMKKGGH